MPELPIGRTKYDENVDRAIFKLPLFRLHLFALMLFPDDEDKRGKFIDSTLLDALGSAIDKRILDQPLSQELVFQLRHAPNHAELLSEAFKPGMHAPEKATKQTAMSSGEMAAFMLLVPMVAHLCHGKPVGRFAAFRILQALAAEKGARMSGTSKRNLELLWGKFKSVAHFWAAYVRFGDIPNDEPGVIAFLSIAETIRRWAEIYCPDRGHPLLESGTAWTVPVTFDVQCADNQDETLRYWLGDVKLLDEWLKIAQPNGRRKKRSN